jgi:competence protein ComGF
VKFTLDEIVYVTIDLICPHDEKIPKDLFYIGEQIITGVNFEGKMPLLNEINIVICRDNLEDVCFYISVMSNTDVTINRPIRIELQCEIFKVLMKLIAESYFKLVLKSVEEKEKFNFSFTFDVYLTQKLKKESLSAYPAVSYQNKHAKDIHFLVSNFCFQEKNRLESSSTKLSQTIDNHIYSESSSSNTFKNAHDSLFELIHSLNNKNNGNSDIEIDLIQEKSCLIPLLRPYQIDAVKWMLRKENFDFTRLDSNWEISDEDVSIFYELSFSKVFQKKFEVLD